MGFFRFHTCYYFGFLFFHFYKIEVLWVVSVCMYITFSCIRRSTALNIPVYEYGMSFHLLVSSFFQIIQSKTTIQSNQNHFKKQWNSWLLPQTSTINCVFFFFFLVFLLKITHFTWNIKFFDKHNIFHIFPIFFSKIPYFLKKIKKQTKNLKLFQKQLSQWWNSRFFQWEKNFQIIHALFEKYLHSFSFLKCSDHFNRMKITEREKTVSYHLFVSFFVQVMMAWEITFLLVWNENNDDWFELKLFYFSF